MRILVTNDDGVFAEGLWALVSELKSIADIVVVAPDREMSGIGTAVSLYQPVRARKVTPMVAGVETYAVEGTPSDSVVLALGKLVKDKVDLVISGINRGSNLGDDVLISGTVGAAVQASLHGLPTFAISLAQGDNLQFGDAAKFATLLAGKFGSDTFPANTCLNVNLPNLPREKIRGVRITHPANKNHTDTIEERYDNGRQHYWLIRQRINKPKDEGTDNWAIEQGNISISSLPILEASNPPPPIPDSLCADLFLIQLGQAQQELLYPRPPAESNNYFRIVLHRLAAHHHPIAKLGMADMVASLKFRNINARGRRPSLIPGIYGRHYLPLLPLPQVVGSDEVLGYILQETGWHTHRA